MSFKPRLVPVDELPWDESPCGENTDRGPHAAELLGLAEWDALGDEADLPDDLRQLAEELQAEAQELARQFPPGERDRAPRPALQQPAAQQPAPHLPGLAGASALETASSPKASVHHATDPLETLPGRGATRRERRLWRWAGPAATLAGLLGLIVVLNSLADAPQSAAPTRPRAPGAPEVAETNPVNPSSAGREMDRQTARQTATGDERSSSERAAFEQARPATTPALFLQEVSGPELEGLLDLMEDDVPRCDISI